MATYYPEHDYDYVAAPAPPPPHAEFVMAPPPPSAFSPSSEPAGHYYPPQSPLVVAASPAPSRNGSRHRASMGEYISAGERNYLAPGGYSSKPLGRSLSERGRDRGQALVEAPRRRSRARSGGIYPDPPPHPRKKYYIDDDGYSHSGSSYGGAGDSRDHSRDQSRHRHYNAHSRTPSCGSTDSRYDDRYALAYPQRPSKMEEELTGKLKEVQRQLERVQVDAEKKRMLDEQQRLERQREVEIERKVKEQMQLEKRKEAERAKKEKDALEAEKRRIAEAAKKLLEEQAAAVKKQKEEEDRKKAEIKAIVEAERQKYAAASSGKKTYTRFSKTHLCKEALEERNIPFTEEVCPPTLLPAAIINPDFCLKLTR